MPWGRTRDDTEVDLCRRPDDRARLEPKDVGRAWAVRESLLHHLARAEANTWGDRRLARQLPRRMDSDRAGARRLTHNRT